jgi:hypothetical protein
MPPAVVLPAKTAATPAAVASTEEPFSSGTLLTGLVMGLGLAAYLARKFKGMSVAEMAAYSVHCLIALVKNTFKALVSLKK